MTAAVYALGVDLGLDRPQDDREWFALGWAVATFAITVFVLFRLLYEKVLWRYKPFSLLMNVPDLSGRWQGQLDSCSFGKRHWNVVTIKQNFDQVFYTSHRMDDESGLPVASERTLACTLRRNAESNKVELVVVYGNSTGTARDTFGFDHEGSAFLRLEDEGSEQRSWLLTGHYWTNKRYPVGSDGRGGTRGKITLTRLASEQEWLAKESESLRKKAWARTSRKQVQDVPSIEGACN